MLCQLLIECVEGDAELVRRGACPLVGEAFFCGALPELDLYLLVAILDAAHGAGAIRGITFEHRRRLGRPGWVEYESKTQRAKIEMQVVLVLEQGRDLVLVAGRNELWGREFMFEILDYVVALDVHGTVVHQHRHQPARVDAEEPRLEVLVGKQVNEVGFPLDALEVEENSKLL